MAKTKETKQEPLEKQLWKAADKLRKNIDAAEYKHVVLGLIFLKYISDAFEEHYDRLKAGEGDLAGADPEDNLIDCIVNLPGKLFLNTQIPTGLWFMNRARNNGHPRKNEILFIDARNLGHLINRRTLELSHDDIQQIASTYHAWRTGDPSPSVGARCTRPDDVTRADAMGAHAMRPYEDVRGFCASVPISRVAELDYVLTPGRYVGLPDEEDDFNFPERFAALKVEFEAQLQEEAALNRAIVESLVRVKL